MKICPRVKSVLPLPHPSFRLRFLKDKNECWLVSVLSSGISRSRLYEKSTLLPPGSLGLLCLMDSRMTHGAESTQAHPKGLCVLPGSVRGNLGVFGPFCLSGSIIQSNNALDINQDPFLIRQRMCAGTDKTGGSEHWGHVMSGGNHPEGWIWPPGIKLQKLRGCSSDLPHLPPAAVQFAPCQRRNLSPPQKEHFFRRQTRLSDILQLSRLKSPPGKAAATFHSKSRCFGFQRVESQPNPPPPPAPPRPRGENAERTNRGDHFRERRGRGIGDDLLTDEIMPPPCPRTR